MQGDVVDRITGVTRLTFIVVTMAAMTAIAYLGFEQRNFRWQIKDLQTQVHDTHSNVQKEITQVRDMSSMMLTTNRKTLKAIQTELDLAKEASQTSAGQSRINADLNVQRLARELRAEQQRQRETQEQVRKQFQDTHQIAAVADARLSAEVGTVRNEIGAVKTDVAQTQANLASAVSDLRHAVGDMGVMSGLIATNRRELELLRSLGDRTYTEFHLTKSKAASMVNGVGLVLKRSDPGKGLFTIELIAEDRSVQKRDRTLNEPVQFYIGHKKQPCEIVVNKVGKDQIAGYLSVPNVNVERE
jgi:hypothetical protein